MKTRAAVRAFFALPRALWEEARITAGAFAVLIAVGFTVATMRPESLDPLLRVLTDATAEAGVYAVDGTVLMTTILANNLLVLLAAIAVGLVPLLHLSALSLGINALFYGGLAAFYYSREDLGLAAFLAGTLPHGLIELSALVLSCAAGLYLCRATTYAVLGHVDARMVGRTLGECLRVYTHWVVPLLILSAFLEAFVTPLIFGEFL